jgi:hypothetical protein
MRIVIRSRLEQESPPHSGLSDTRNLGKYRQTRHVVRGRTAEVSEKRKE